MAVASFMTTLGSLRGWNPPFLFRRPSRKIGPRFCYRHLWVVAVVMVVVLVSQLQFVNDRINFHLRVSVVSNESSPAPAPAPAPLTSHGRPMLNTPLDRSWSSYETAQFILAAPGHASALLSSSSSSSPSSSSSSSSASASSSSSVRQSSSVSISLAEDMANGGAGGALEQQQALLSDVRVNVNASELLSTGSSSVGHGSKDAGPSGPKSQAEKKSSIDDSYVVPGWPPEVSLNVTHYVDLNSAKSVLLWPSREPRTSEQEYSDKQFKVVIAAQTAPANLVERMEVRSTWGKACNSLSWCQLVFVIGTVPNNQTVHEQIINEHFHYEDILQEDFVDSYNNLSLKSVLTLKYFVNLNDERVLLLKTDDDSYIHLAGLRSLLDSERRKNHDKILIGYLQKGHKKHKYLPFVHRPVLLSSSLLKKHKEWERWLVPKYMFPERFFPKFLSGSGYLMSLPVAKCILTASQHIRLVHLEDVYITGLCASSCGIEREHHSGFKPRGLPKDKLKIKKYDIVIHRMSGQMEALMNIEENSASQSANNATKKAT